MSQAHRKYFNNLASEWQTLMPDDASLLKYVDRFNVKSGDIVLDAGAGTGRLSKHLLARNPRGRLIVQDIAREMLIHGRQNLPHEQAFWVCDDLTRMAFRDDVFDKIICFSMFPHIQKPKQALKECYRVLKPGGRLLIFHTSGSHILNAFHASLKAPVNSDRLMEASVLADMIKTLHFNIIAVEESETLYWVESEKTRLSNTN